jgi:hypothetical protein
MTPRTGQPVLGHAAAAFRVAHTLIPVIDLGGLSYVWYCVITRRRNRMRDCRSPLCWSRVPRAPGPCAFGPGSERHGITR